MPEIEIPTPATLPGAQAPAAPAQEPAETDWQKEARKWEDRAKANKKALDDATPKLTEYDRLVQASKTDAQRLEDAANAAKQEADDARAEALRYRVALKHGIGEEDFDFLGSGTEAELTARAERLAAKNAAAGQQTGPRAPAPNPAQGSPGGPSSDPKAQFAALVQSRMSPR